MTREVVENIARGCLDIHKNAHSANEALKNFRLLVDQAWKAGYEKGLTEGKQPPVVREDDKAPVVKGPAVPETNIVVGANLLGKSTATKKTKESSGSQPTNTAATTAAPTKETSSSPTPSSPSEDTPAPVSSPEDAARILGTF